MASVFDVIDEKVEYITWRDVCREGFKDSQTISPWYEYRLEVDASIIGLGFNGKIFIPIAQFYPEHKANYYIGPAQDKPARLCYKTQLQGEEYIIENPTTEDLKLVMGIIRMVNNNYINSLKQ